MKLSTLVLSTFSVVAAVVSPVTNAALREYMAQRRTIASQQRAIHRGYHRPRPRCPGRGRAISLGKLMNQIQRAEKAAATFAAMLKITEKY